jgi:hypothetical protein
VLGVATKGTKKAGRPKVPRKRLGKIEAETVKKLLAVIKRFEIKKAETGDRETKLNTRLMCELKAEDDRVVNKDIKSVQFINETYRPECTLSAANFPYSLFALECKKLHDHSAKRLFKEGLAQASLYLTQSKVVTLVLYDFTTGREYAKAFGRGNTSSARFAKRAREELGLYVVVLSPQ